jgi:hypothetical protein
MGKIVSQIVEREFSNQFPLLFVRLAFEGAEPMMDASLSKLGVTL